MLGGPVVQVAIVVSDLDAALRRYAEIFGGDRWRCYTFGSFGQHEYYGAPTRFTVRLVLNDASPQIELIQPLEGNSIHRDWLEERGEGLHHIAVVVPSLAEVVEAMAELGYPVMQSGRGFGVDGDRDGAYAYIDMTAALGVIVEPIEQPSSLPPPEAIWPAGS
jgi:methylmalonyl-CoA/ethylmalonyl-CoA epimerase